MLRYGSSAGILLTDFVGKFCSDTATLLELLQRIRNYLLCLVLGSNCHSDLAFSCHTVALKTRSLFYFWAQAQQLVASKISRLFLRKLPAESIFKNYVPLWRPSWSRLRNLVLEKKNRWVCPGQLSHLVNEVTGFVFREEKTSSACLIWRTLATYGLSYNSYFCHFCSSCCSCCAFCCCYYRLSVFLFAFVCLFVCLFVYCTCEIEDELVGHCASQARRTGNSGEQLHFNYLLRMA